MNYYKTYYEYNEKEIRELLLYRKVVEVRGNTLVLDNGTELTFEGNEGCPGCGNGWYSVTELNECDNVITNVEFVCDNDTKNKYDDETSYKIFVYAEDKHIKLAQIDGDDGNGYYGTGYTLYVKFNQSSDKED